MAKLGKVGWKTNLWLEKLGCLKFGNLRNWGESWDFEQMQFEQEECREFEQEVCREFEQEEYKEFEQDLRFGQKGNLEWKRGNSEGVEERNFGLEENLCLGRAEARNFGLEENLNLEKRVNSALELVRI